MTRRALELLLTLGFAVAAATAVVAQTAQRGAEPVAATGTAVIRGRVVAAESGRPVRKAQVRLMPISANPNAPPQNRVIATDAEGAYEFSGVAAGRYVLNANKGGYVGVSYGQQRANDPVKTLEVVDGQILDRVDFALPRGGVITGRVVDEYGEPLSNIQVAAVRFMVMNGRRQLMNAGRSASTDDLGEFRLYGLAAGAYFVQATWRSPTPAAPPGGVAEDRTGYAPTLFPAAADAVAAQRIAIDAGTTVSDVNITMIPARTATISGTVVNSRGEPTAGNLMVMRDGGNGFAGGAPIRPDGTFSIANLTPGEYTLRAQQNGAIGSEIEMAVAKITANGEDITGLRLVASPPSTLSGRVVVDPASITGATMPRVTLAATPMDPESMMVGTAPGRTTADGAFELRSQPGRILITLMPAGIPGGGMQTGGWMIRAVRVDGVDVTDAGIDVKPNQRLDKIEVEITNRLTTISGVVTDDRGEPAKTYLVVAFSQNRELWIGTTRYRGIASSDGGGRYKMTSLPAGSYYIVAVERTEPGEWQDPEFLARVLPKATAFTVADGDTRTIDLKLSPSR